MMFRSKFKTLLEQARTSPSHVQSFTARVLDGAGGGAALKTMSRTGFKCSPVTQEQVAGVANAAK